MANANNTVLTISSISADTMNNTTPVISSNYYSPLVWIIPLNLEDVINGSPQIGGNEDIGYDDWEQDDD